MTTALAHSWFMTVRHLRALARQPWYVAFTLVQPMLYLLLFGELFERVTDLPGFAGGSYISYLTPGIVVVSALFSAGWSGAGVIDDIDRGVLDRFLTAPTSRIALVLGRLTQLALVTIVQSAIIILVGLVLGARFTAGPVGLAVLVVCAVLLAASFGALSCGMALLARKQESVIAAVNFLLQPLAYTSTVFMAPTLLPEWMQVVARVNPVNWAAEAGREALQTSVAWDLVLWRSVCLLLFFVACSWLAAHAFRAYQRSA
ncbi:MAG TPA: ABC transporter permease [Chloroflexota bacterium]